MSGEPIPKKVVILGGGTAGWMTAAALARHLSGVCDVQLIESEEIGIVGVGEATLPHIRAFVEGLGINGAEFMAATQATIKLGIEFRDFGALGTRYLHPFGDFGRKLNGVELMHYWRRMQHEGHHTDLFDYSIANIMATHKKFAPPVYDNDHFLGTYNYAYQFDATLFAPFLRQYAEKRGVKRTQGRMTHAEQHPQTGDITALILDNGEQIKGDIFIDCSGFAALLIGRALKSPWEDWSHWLPCDRAVAMPCASGDDEIEPYTRATAMSAGWRWRIPLQHRVGNGYVYSSAHISDNDAAKALVSAVEGNPQADPRFLSFKAGRRTQSWTKNVVSIGLASGFLEPLESTSIYLVQGAIQQLIELFPIGDINEADRTEYNRMVDIEYDRIRDFLILHYHATTRSDSDFWNDARTMKVPASLQEKLDLFRHSGRVQQYSHGLFLEPSWIAVMIGQGVTPKHWDQRADNAPTASIQGTLKSLREHLGQLVRAMPTHGAYLARRGASVSS
jgi:tryptophan 7-halogenase